MPSSSSPTEGLSDLSVAALKPPVYLLPRIICCVTLDSYLDPVTQLLGLSVPCPHWQHAESSVCSLGVIVRMNEMIQL